MEERVEKLEKIVSRLQNRVAALEGNGDGGKAPKSSQKKKSKGKDKGKDKASQKKGGSKKKKKKDDVKKAISNEGEKFRSSVRDHTKTDYYHVISKKMYVEVPEPFEFGTEHKVGPAKKLELEYAYGYNGSIRDNLVQLNENEIAYCLAGVAVVTNINDTTQQRFFRGHNEDVTCIARCPDSNLVATGQRDPKDALSENDKTPYVCIWDSTNMNELGRLCEVFLRSVCSVGFTCDGQYIVAIGDDDNHTASVFKMEKIANNSGEYIRCKKPIIGMSTSKEPVFGHSHCPEMIDGKYVYVSYGNQLKWWEFDPNTDNKPEILTEHALNSYSKTKVVQKKFLCVEWTHENDLLVGLPDGHIYMFNKHNKEIRNWWDTGSKAIVGLKHTGEGQYRALTSAGGAFWYDSTQTDDKNKKAHALVNKVKSLVPKSLGKITVAVDIGETTYCGTSNSHLLAVSVNGEDSEYKSFVAGHTKEIWGLAAHPSKPWVCCAGDDKRFRVWDYETKSVVFEHKGGSGFRTADFSRDGNILALGCINGSIATVDLTDEEYPLVDHGKFAKEEISAVSFARNGNMMLAGSWDQMIHVLKKSDGKWKKAGKPLRGHTSSITHLTISEDGKHAQSCSKDIEMLYWDLSTRKRIDYLPPTIIWDRWNAIFGWCVQGLFFQANDVTDVNACEVSGGNEIDDEGGNKMVVSGDDTGHVTVFKYPILEHKPKKYDQYLAHSAHVTNVRWAEDDSKLFSVGGGDLAMFQWSVQDK